MPLVGARFNRARTERGATAVIVGIVAIVLFACAAIGVDMGNALARKRSIQGQADFGALAAASELPGVKSPSDPAVLAVVEYLNRNHPLDDEGITAVTANDLVDGPAVDPDESVTEEEEKNGEIYFESNSRLRVIAPQARVNFGLAAALEFKNVNVNAEATVGIFSAGNVLPVYAVDGCDYGPQTFTDPAGGLAVPVTRPPMRYDTEPPAFNNASLASLTTLPTAVSKDAVGAELTISGNQFNTAASGIVRVGFFRDRTIDSPDFFEVAPTFRTATQIRAIIPTTVTAVEDVWWIRVFKGDAAGVGSWSEPTEALPLRVGQAVLECESSGPSDGNFGTLDLPRTDVSSQDDMIAKNIVVGPEFTLAVMPAGGPSPLCTGATTPAVHSPNDGTNCVDTKTGLPANATTQGLVTGVDGEPGRLIGDTSDLCRDSAHGLRPQNVPSGISGYDVNDDILTCFLTNNTTSIEDLSKEGAAYTSGVVLDPAIYSSPRFFWVPVLFDEPSSGGSNEYSIMEFRPAFLTDQPPEADAINHTVGATTNNGLYVAQPAGNSVSRVKVVFFNEEALPTDVGDAPLTDWLGFGPKILRLVD